MRLSRPRVAEEARAAGEAQLEELLADVPADPEWDDERHERFEGAVDMLAGLGAVDAATWDARLRRHVGWPTAEEERAQVLALNAGGTEVELVAVRPGPPERRAGRHVVVALRYEDGVAFLIDKDPAATPQIEWPEWRLTDDQGTSYRPGGSGGSDTDEHVSFRTALPTDARWVELALEGHPEATFRVAL